MTPKQKHLYWREWSAVRHADPTADRHQLHAEALGAPKSSSNFNNEDLDKVLAVFRAISQPWNLNAQLASANQPRKRLLFAIQEQMLMLSYLLAWKNGDLHLGEFQPAANHPLAIGYVASISRDKFHETDIESIANNRPTPQSYTDLEMLRMTLAARISELRQDASMSVHRLRVDCGLPCHCSICAKWASQNRATQTQSSDLSSEAVAEEGADEAFAKEEQ